MQYIAMHRTELQCDCLELWLVSIRAAVGCKLNPRAHFRLEIGGDGVFFFKTEIPGSELSAGWGPDPMPHIHYDILCSNCTANEYFSGEYRCAPFPPLYASGMSQDTSDQRCPVVLKSRCYIGT
jgi:hypothetical protein